MAIDLPRVVSDIVQRSVANLHGMSLMAKLVDVGSIGCYFESAPRPQAHTQSAKHLLVDIAVISVCGITLRV